MLTTSIAPPRRRAILVAMTLASATWTAACGSESGTPTGPEPDTNEVASVSMDPEVALLDSIGAWVTVTATAWNINGEKVQATFHWASSDTSVARFSGGRVIAAGYGTSIVSAFASNGIGASVEVEVAPPS